MVKWEMTREGTAGDGIGSTLKSVLVGLPGAEDVRACCESDHVVVGSSMNR